MERLHCDGPVRRGPGGASSQTLERERGHLSDRIITRNSDFQYAVPGTKIYHTEYFDSTGLQAHIASGRRAQQGPEDGGRRDYGRRRLPGVLRAGRVPIAAGLHHPVHGLLLLEGT